MSYIPDCREEYKSKFNGQPTEEKNPYWEGNLNESDKKVVMGYDFCVENIENMEFSDFTMDIDFPEEVSVKDAKIVLDGFKEWLLRGIECERDELIVSTIESYPEEGEDESD